MILMSLLHSIKDGTLSRAKRKGVAIQPKIIHERGDVNEVVVAFRPDLFGAYFTILDKYHQPRLTRLEADLLARVGSGSHHLARAIADAALGATVRQLRYKTRWYGSTLITADRWYPSTKRCSRCGQVKKDAIPLEERTFHCEECGLVEDRDLNAAKNLAEWPGVARTLETPVEGGVQSTAAKPLLIQPPSESGTISLGRGPRRWM